MRRVPDAAAKKHTEVTGLRPELPRERRGWKPGYNGVNAATNMMMNSFIQSSLILKGISSALQTSNGGSVNPVTGSMSGYSQTGAFLAGVAYNNSHNSWENTRFGSAEASTNAFVAISNALSNIRSEGMNNLFNALSFTLDNAGVSAYSLAFAGPGDPPTGPLPQLPNLWGLEHTIGPMSIYLSSPAPKPRVPMKGPTTSPTTSVLSKTLRNLPEKKISSGKLYTHTVNGAKKYATTWNAYLGRWGTKLLGPIGAAITVYDGVSLLAPYFKGALDDYRASHPINQSGNLIYHLPH